MPDDTGASAPWLVVGLGNPGPRYAGNRHNVGAMVVAQLAADLGARLGTHRSRALVAQTRTAPAGGLPGESLVLAVPTSYMNESGGQVSSVVKFFKVPPERLLVVHDELDLPFADLMLKRGGGEGGHNGLRSVSQSHRHARLLSVADRDRPPARPDGSGRLRAARLLVHGAQGARLRRLRRRRRRPLGRRRRVGARPGPGQHEPERRSRLATVRALDCRRRAG